MRAILVQAPPQEGAAAGRGIGDREGGGWGWAPGGPVPPVYRAHCTDASARVLHSHQDRRPSRGRIVDRRYPHAAACFSLSILALLGPEDVSALDAFEWDS